MSEGGTRDLTLWDITHWVPLTVRMALTSSVLIPVATVGFTVSFSVDNLHYGVIFGLLASAGAWFKSSVGPLTLRRVAFRGLFSVRTALLALAAGMTGGVLVVIAPQYVRDAGLATSVLFGVIGFGTFTFLAWLGLGLSGQTVPQDNPAPPGAVVREDLITACVTALVFGVAMASGNQFGLVAERGRGNPSEVLEGFAQGAWWSLQGGAIIGVVMAAGLSQGFQLMIAQVCLAVRYRTPLRLTRFLADAHERHLLRVVGPIYQFRHATLQDRLAGATTRQSVSP